MKLISPIALVCSALLPLYVQADMVVIPAGKLTMGNNSGPADERPMIELELAAFSLDRSPVTVAEFGQFASATNYQTTAEKFGDSAVFSLETGSWALVSGTTWRHPTGPSHPAAQSDHPVTHVSWYDATQYCSHFGKRLPTEAEWEHASRNGRNDRTIYAFGDEIIQDGAFLANVWNGEFPFRNTGDDGYLFTSPVGTFATTALGLSDMAGNVWEWTSDWYQTYGTPQLTTPGSVGAEKVQRGGSFLCDQEVCHGYKSSTRAHTTPESSHMHVGFRCAMDLPGN